MIWAKDRHTPCIYGVALRMRFAVNHCTLAIKLVLLYIAHEETYLQRACMHWWVRVIRSHITWSRDKDVIIVHARQWRAAYASDGLQLYNEQVESYKAAISRREPSLLQSKRAALSLLQRYSITITLWTMSSSLSWTRDLTITRTAMSLLTIPSYKTWNDRLENTKMKRRD